MWDLPVDGSKTLPPPPLTLAHLPKPDQADLTSLDWNHDGSLLAIGSYDAILRVCTSSCELYFAHEQHKVSYVWVCTIVDCAESTGGEGSDICHTLFQDREMVIICKSGWHRVFMEYTRQKPP